MKLYAKFGWPVLLALVLTLASCGGAGGGDAQIADRGSKDNSGGMPGMKGMDHDSGGIANGMRTKNGKYSDERFIDAMVPHHERAVEMAKVALKNAEHLEIKRLTKNIITTQKTEIEELKSIKIEEFDTSRVPMNMGQMKGMGMMTDPRTLADRDPFDKAFIDSMIPHHQSAIEMAQVARDKSDNPKIEELATNIISAQKREISQMEPWRAQWYQEGSR